MPFNDIAKLRLDLHAKVDELRTLQETISEREDKKPTEDEKLKSQALREEICNREEEIANKEVIQRLEMQKTQETENNSSDNNEKEFRNFGEFLKAIIEGRTEKLVRAESRDMTMGAGISAGYLVPDEFGGMLRSFDPDAALVRPRATYLGGGSDANISFTSFDQTGSKGVYGGVTVNWISETGTKPESNLYYQQLKFEPKEVAGFIDVSNKLLRNAPEVSGYIERQLGLAIQGSEDQKFVDGSGVGCPLGFIGHSSSIEIARNTASDVVYADLTTMYSRLRYSASALWVINQTVLPELMSMVDAGSNLIWQPNARDGAPSTIFGIPVVYSDLLPTLGTKGDVCLVDLSYYGVRDGSNVAMFIDPYSQSANQLTRIYVYWNVDGQPLVSTPLLLRDGSNTVSPFIILN